MSELESPIRVLLVEDETDSLATLGVALLEKGFEVSVVGDPRTALESIGPPRFDVFLVAEETLRALGPKLDALLRERPEPHLVLVGDAETAWAKNEVSRADADLIAQRVKDLLLGTAATSGVPSSGSRFGNLARGWLQPVVESFLAERVTGMLSVTTPEGAGELRFARGELVDAVYSTLEGLKAFYRLARETEGSWAFTEASSLVMRRITLATGELLRLLPRELERTSELMSALGDLTGWAILVDPPEGRVLGPLAAAMAERMSAPRTLRALLDESPETDADLLAALVELDGAVLLRRVRMTARSAAFESPSQIDRAVAQAAQAHAAGFRGPVRVVFAGPVTSLALLGHGASRLEEAILSGASPPEAPVPHEIVKLRLSEDSAVALVALPLDPVYSPLWPLVVAGASAVISLSADRDPRLAAVCTASEVTLLDAPLLVPDLDLGNPEQVARLVRAALGADG
jgi:hypothetical protein